MLSLEEDPRFHCIFTASCKGKCNDHVSYCTTQSQAHGQGGSLVLRCKMDLTDSEMIVCLPDSIGQLEKYVHSCHVGAVSSLSY